MSLVAESLLKFTKLDFKKNFNKKTMPAEDLTEQGLAKNPNLELAQWKFLLSLPEYAENNEIKEKLLKAIQEVSKQF